MMMNIPSLHMMNIIPSTDSILSTSSTSPALDQMAAAAARLLHGSTLVNRINGGGGGEAYYNYNYRMNGDAPNPGNIPSPTTIQTLMSDGIRFNPAAMTTTNPNHANLLLPCAMDASAPPPPHPPPPHGFATSSAYNSQTEVVAYLNMNMSMNINMNMNMMMRDQTTRSEHGYGYGYGYG